MIIDILLQSKKLAEKAGQPSDSVNAVVVENFKIVATVLYYLFMQVIENEITDGYQKEEDTPGNDEYSLYLIELDKVSIFFNFEDPDQDQFLDEMKDLIKNWLKRLELVLGNADLIRQKNDEK